MTLKVSWIDVKLGLRMFAKYPGLSLVSVVGLALAIAIGAGYFAMFGPMLGSRLPFDEGRRVLLIQTRTVTGAAAGGIGRSTVQDFERWRDEVRSVAHLSAFADHSRNLITADGRVYPALVAAITASGLGLTGVVPALGRTLVADDERPSAAPVLVIAYDDWQGRFNGDPAVVGQTVHLDETPHTIVGVMPHGFEFPVRHRYWVPLHASGAGEAPTRLVHVFGRLAGGYTLEDARAELAMAGERAATALPHTHQDVRPVVSPYTDAWLGLDSPGAQVAFRSIQFGFSLLLLVVAVNVAILVYARTVTRTGEIAVRTALGASRSRVVTQLFVEALVPALGAAAIGLGLLAGVFRLVRGYVQNSPDADGPYWLGEAAFTLSPGVIVYAAGLATLAALVAGVLPALKATGRRVQEGLQQFSTRGAGMRLGATWTTLIVVQVAMAVTALPGALYKTERAWRIGMREAPAAAAPLLRATLVASEADRSAPGAARDAQDVARAAARMTAWMHTIESEPAITAVTYADRFPGEEASATVEIDRDGPEAITLRAQPSRVATNFFDVLGVRLLAGRGFTVSDTMSGATSVIVDQTFAERLAPGDVLGRRIRSADLSPGGSSEDTRWFEIIGVVPAFAASFAPPVGFRDLLPRIYHAARPGDVQPAAVIVQARSGEQAGIPDRLRAVTAALDPTLKLEGVAGVAQQIDRERQALRYMALGLIAVTGSVLLLSSAGIYAMMSFTVAKRRREIGIRAALGADTRRVLTGIFGRAAAQIGAGVAAGLAVAILLEQLTGGELMGRRGHVLLPLVATLMFATGVLASLGPARRGLAVQPTDALRED